MITPPLTGPLQWYRAFGERPDFVADPAQEQVVARLQQLHEDLMAFKRHRQRLLAKTFGNRPPPRGLYLFGGVGRGKSALMDGFFSTLAFRRKRRVHFHEFMAQVQQRMHQLQHQEDPLRVVAAEIAVQTRVLCFDEFHVSDIADAMILQRLLESMITWGVVLVITSNYAPKQLYPDGLQRERFLPAIALLEERLDVLEIPAGQDHRRRDIQHQVNYYYPLGDRAASAMQQRFEQLCVVAQTTANVDLMGRHVPVRGVGQGVIWFDFDTLCGSARSQRDYLELAQHYHTVLLSDVPALTPLHREVARRLTWLVDIFYDRHIHLLISAETLPEGLYPEGVLSGEFVRTVSRLQEMQSAQWQLEHTTLIS